MRRGTLPTGTGSSHTTLLVRQRSLEADRADERRRGPQLAGTAHLDLTMVSGALVQQAVGKIKDVLTGGDEATDRRTGPGAEMRR
jgi:hypothetical protein